ncbi:MAG: hypothetical protein V1875_00310 [Candidatus Altiarchaeota archaeon]
MDAVGSGRIDVFADVSDGLVTFQGSSSIRSLASVKRLRQVLLGQKRDQIYLLAEANASMDGILLPIKVRTASYSVDYSKATDPSVLTRRIRLLNRDSMDNGMVLSGVNILDADAVRRMDLALYLNESDSLASNETLDLAGFTLPEEWEVPFVFKSLYNNMAVVSVSILLSIMLTLSFAREKVNRTMEVLFMSPTTRLDILAGKSLPYVALMLAVNMGYCLSTSSGMNSLKMFYIFSVLSFTLAAFATFTVLASRNYREVTFMSSLCLLSFLIFIVFPNVFSGVNLLAFVSPLDTVTSIQNQAGVGFGDVFLSLLPYKFLFMFFLSASIVCFSPETFQNTPGLAGLMRMFYHNLRKSFRSDILFVITGISLLVPFVYIVQTLIAYLIIPLGLFAPYAAIVLLALVEELTKIIPFYYTRRNMVSGALVKTGIMLFSVGILFGGLLTPDRIFIVAGVALLALILVSMVLKPSFWPPLSYGILSGCTFFLTEKAFNIYLISKVYSYLPAPYTLFIVKGLAYTLLLHILATTTLAFVISGSSGKYRLYSGLVLTTAIHYGYNVYMMGGGLIR